MDVQKKLARLAEIDGFLGAALFSAEGRLLAKCEPFDIDLKLVATLANTVLVNSQKASVDMGFGRSQFTYFHTEKAMVLLRCLNEGRNPLRAEPGKCHIHLVLLVENAGEPRHRQAGDQQGDRIVGRGFPPAADSPAACGYQKENTKKDDRTADPAQAAASA